MSHYITIQTLWQQGQNKSSIARLTGHDWKTVDKIIKAYEAGKQEPSSYSRKSMLDDHKPQLLKWLEQGLSGLRIHQELGALGVAISYPSVTHYLRSLKLVDRVCLRFHTDPGEEAQVDFGYVGLTYDNHGKRRKTWVFNMRLSYSRLDYYEKVYDQTVATFIRCHIHAFRYFGGVPRTVKIDNLKAAILQASFYEAIYQRQYAQFAKHTGFQPIPCKVRRPQEKGKVESGIKYVKSNFFKGRSFSSGHDCDHQLRHWLDHTCNKRVHGTTKKVPDELFRQEEKNCLLPLPLETFSLSTIGQRRVQKDSHIYVAHNYYSVPCAYMGEQVLIEYDDKQLKCFNAQHEQIALHSVLSGQGKWSTIQSHYPDYLDFDRDKQALKYWQKLGELGGCSLRFGQQLKVEQPYHWLQSVKGVLKLQEQFSPSIIEQACERALVYGAISYRKLKSICESGCYALSLDHQQEVVH